MCYGLRTPLEASNQPGNSCYSGTSISPFYPCFIPAPTLIKLAIVMDYKCCHDLIQILSVFRVNPIFGMAVSEVKSCKKVSKLKGRF